jgi:hypothetical protein
MKIRKSFVTNSSSSSFILAVQNGDPDLIELELRAFFDNYNVLMGTNWKFDDCVGSVYKYRYTEKRDKHDWRYGWECKENDGKIVINSEGDNSIPYELMNLIESKFNAERYHNG